MDNTKLILGIKIDRDPILGDIILSQNAYAQKMLSRFSMNEYAPLFTPLPAGSALLNDNYPTSPEEISKISNTLYKEVLGAIM